MEIIEIKTLIDITDTGIKRLGQGTQQEFDQYKNYTTLKQCVELRSVISYDFAPNCTEVDVKGMGFGRMFKGRHRVWTWRIRPDRELVFADGDNPIGGLISDIDQVPVIKKLNETINIDKPVFELSDTDLKNTIIKTITGNE